MKTYIFRIKKKNNNGKTIIFIKIIYIYKVPFLAKNVHKVQISIFSIIDVKLLEVGKDCVIIRTFLSPI